LAHLALWRFPFASFASSRFKELAMHLSDRHCG
jgi:hypothetical protein